MTSQWAMTLPGMPIVTSQWVMMLLRTSIVNVQWVMALVCVHIMASQCIITLPRTSLLCITMAIYGILLWVVWNQTRTSSCWISLGSYQNTLCCVGLFHSFFGLIKYPYTTPQTDHTFTCSCYNIISRRSNK